VIGTKWVFKNKYGEDGEIMRNKAHLVAQGFSQVEGLDFGETRKVGFLVEPQNQGRRFVSGFASKPLGWFSLDWLQNQW
jgi:hypothetical protein